jgi:hypothetical protein
MKCLVGIPIVVEPAEFLWRNEPRESECGPVAASVKK